MTTLPTNMASILRLVGETPGYHLTDASSGNFRVVRNTLTHAGHTVPEVSKVVSVRTKDGTSAFRNVIAALRRDLGWTIDLYDLLQDVLRTHRAAQTDPADDVTTTLMNAYLPGWDQVPEEEPDLSEEEKRARLRHDRLKAGESRKGAGIQTGASTAPVQLVPDVQPARAEKISPERALDLLCTVAEYQRRLKESVVAEYKASMERGEWRLLASAPICIDRDGKLCNGLHRMEAVFRSGLGQEFYVAYDVDPDTYPLMDRGARRTTSDTLYGKFNAAGEIPPGVSMTILGSLLKVIDLWENEPQEMWGTLHRNMSETQILAALDRHPDALDSAQGSLRLGKLKIRPTSAAFAHYMIMHANGFDPDVREKIVNPWYAELRTPRLIRPGDPAWALREWFLTGDQSKRKTLPTPFDSLLQHVYLILQAWEATCQGRSLRRLSWKPDFRITTASPVTEAISFPPND